MAALKMSHLTKEYVHVGVTLTDDGGGLPGTITADMAFPVAGQLPQFFFACQVVGRGAKYDVKTLVGPSGQVALPAGTYDVWVRIDDSTELAVRKAGSLLIS